MARRAGGREPSRRQLVAIHMRAGHARPLQRSEEDLEKIAALMLDEYKPGLAAHGITLHYTQPALADIVAESSTKYGARELRRTIRKTIEDPVSDALVDGRLDGREVTLELADHDGRAVLEI